MSSCNKTPVAVLHELCVRRSIIEQYNLVAERGTPNDRLFEMSVETSEGLIAYGSGKTKKEAKHNAAQEALNKMTVPAIMPGAQIPKAEGGPPVVNPHTDRGSTGNAVGRLQEYCAENGLPLPVYELTGDEGEPHNRTFSMKCEVSRRYETGIGRTKRLAKQNAAQAMYETLINNPSLCKRLATLQVTLNLSHEEREHIVDTYSSHLATLNVPTTNPGLKFSTYHESLKTHLSCVKDDLTVELFPSPEDTLKAIAEKLGLTVLYYQEHNAEHSNNGEHYVYAVVNTQPITVQLGEGQSVSTATAEASLKVLKYWQIFVGIFPII